MEWYWRLGSAVMLLASGIVSILVVERVHDLRRPDATSFTTPRLLMADVSAPLFSRDRAHHSSSPAMPVAAPATASIDSEFRGHARSRCNACTGTPPDDMAAERC